MEHGDSSLMGLARKWSRQLGYKVEEEKGALVLKGSGATPSITANDGVLMISCTLQLEDKASEATKPDKLLHLFIGRSAYAFLPPENNLPPKHLLIYQRIKIKTSSESSEVFNRFADGVQEVINATLLTVRVLGGARMALVPDGMYR